MKQHHIKKIFQHGSSKAIDLPADFGEKISSSHVSLELRKNGLFIPIDSPETIESDPLFAQFIETVVQDALKHPDKLKSLDAVWDKEWNELLDGVDDTDK